MVLFSSFYSLDLHQCMLIETFHSYKPECRSNIYLRPRPRAPHWWAAVCAAGLPSGRGGLGALRFSQGVCVDLAGSLGTLDLTRLYSSSAAPAARPPLA